MYYAHQGPATDDPNDFPLDENHLPTRQFRRFLSRKELRDEVERMKTEEPEESLVPCPRSLVQQFYGHQFIFWNGSVYRNEQERWQAADEGDYCKVLKLTPLPDFATPSEELPPSLDYYSVPAFGGPKRRY